MALQHLRASVANKRPAPSGMSDGQLAINTNDASPGLFFKNAGGVLVKIGPVHVGTAAPNVTPASGGTSGNTTGELWLDSTGGDYALKTWDGSAWQTTVVTSGMIKDGTIGNADINDSAAIALSKLATGALPTGITVSSGNIVDGTITNADINTSAGIVYSKLTLSSGIVDADISGSAAIAYGKLALSSGIVNADINGSAAIALSKLATGALPTGITIASGNIIDGTIVDADINASAAIAGTKISPDFGSQSITTSGDITIGDKIIHDGDTNTAIRFPAADTITFETDNAERARIDSSGRLLVGTSSARSVGQVTQPIQNETTSSSAGVACVSNRDDINGSYVVLAKSRGTVLGSNTIVQNNDQFGAIVFSAADGTDMNSSGAYIQAFVDGTPGTDDMPGRLVFSTTSDGDSSPTERMRITSVGEVRIGNSAGVSITSSSSNGHEFFGDGAAYHARAGNVPLFIGRNTNDGTLVSFYQAGTNEGTISVAGSTVSYNPFLGSHWGRLADGSKPDILPGTILDTVDQLIEWKQAKFTVDGEEKIAAYNGAAEVGDTVEIDYEGTSYSAIVQNEEEEPEELNKHVCVKVNDTASSKAVFGVFLGWDYDIPENMVSTWNDLYCAAVGNYFVRIADGETLEIGSLIEADGNGCGIVQDDDIIRSKTVAKITSTIPQKVYDDGSFLVTCVLCCG